MEYIKYRQSSTQDKHYEYCTSNGHVIVKMPSEGGKWLKFHRFTSILKLVHEKHRAKMNKTKTERKVKSPYTEEINASVPPEWCVRST